MVFPKDAGGRRWDATACDPVTRVRLQGVGCVKVHQHRPVVGKVKTVSVRREGRHWHTVLTADQAQPEPLPAKTALGLIREQSATTRRTLTPWEPSTSSGRAGPSRRPEGSATSPRP